MPTHNSKLGSLGRPSQPGPRPRSKSDNPTARRRRRRLDFAVALGHRSDAIAVARPRPPLACRLLWVPYRPFGQNMGEFRHQQIL
ncbi:hypothetical protein VTI74DRAFT_1030 [Chaetomium olivicolor]